MRHQLHKVVQAAGQLGVSIGLWPPSLNCPVCLHY